ncbi:MAG: carbohydrate kinase family protein [Candidatus Saccharimonadales bacterium]
MAESNERKQIDIVSIGDVVIDDFIRLNDDQAWTYVDDTGKKVLAMEFGTKLPFDDHDVVYAVGNAANAAVAFTYLELDTSFATNVGDDQYGRDIITTLKKNGVETNLVRVHPHMNSNYHFVLRYKAERTILIKHKKYRYEWPKLHGIDIPKWVYFSSVSEHALEYHDQICDWLDEHPEVKVAFQPGTFQMIVGAERLKRLYQKSDVLILNREEAVTVGGGNHADVHDLMNKLHDLGAKIVVVTDGPDGAYASDGNEAWKMPLYPDPAPPVDRTGAGDAFASTFVAALAHGDNIEAALQWAPINSMSVCQGVGAQAGLLKKHELEDYLRKAPEWYKPERF